MTPVRAVLSLLVAAAGTFVVALCVSSLVVMPQRTTERPPAAMGTDSAAIALFILPLLMSVGLLIGLLLIWSGVRGTRSASAPALWRRRQRPALWGCGIGAGLVAFVYLFGAEPWTGLPEGSSLWALAMLVLYSVLSFLVLAVLALQQGGRDGPAPHEEGGRERHGSLNGHGR